MADAHLSPLQNDMKNPIGTIDPYLKAEKIDCVQINDFISLA
jgi:hypothetical protein